MGLGKSNISILNHALAFAKALRGKMQDLPVDILRRLLTVGSGCNINLNVRLIPGSPTETNVIINHADKQ